MTFSLAEQTLVFLEAILLGFLGGIVYDICRAVRQTLNFKTKGTFIVDAIFSITVLIALFYFAVTDAVSQMRFYIILGEILGMILYFLSFTQFLLPIFKLIIDFFIFILSLPSAFIDFIMSKAYIFEPVFKLIGKQEIIKKIKKRLSFFRKSG